MNGNLHSNLPPLQVKLPMLLSKPKKSYKSVSKTDLMTEQEKDQEEDQKVDIFAYEEMNINQDLVRKQFLICIHPHPLLLVIPTPEQVFVFIKG